MNSRRCPYEILGVTETATDEEIRHAYEVKAFDYHPETYRDKDGKRDTSKFKEILYAYSVLSNPQKRGAYDQYGEMGLRVERFGDDLAGYMVKPWVKWIMIVGGVLTGGCFCLGCCCLCCNQFCCNFCCGKCRPKDTYNEYDIEQHIDDAVTTQPGVQQDSLFLSLEE